MTDKQEKSLEKAIKEQMIAAKNSGMLVGFRTCAQIILDKAKSTDREDKERLDDVIEYCEWGLKT